MKSVISTRRSTRATPLGVGQHALFIDCLDRALGHACTTIDAQRWIDVEHLRIAVEVADLTEVPSLEAEPDAYRDWGDPRIYTTGDQGVGECAGELVSPLQFALANSERQIFEAQVLLDDSKPAQAADRARVAMTEAAYWLTREQVPDLSNEPAKVVAAFREQLLDTARFDAASVGGRFGHFLIRAHARPIGDDVSPEAAHQLIEEAQLFVDAAHQYELTRSEERRPVKPST